MAFFLLVSAIVALGCYFARYSVHYATLTTIGSIATVTFLFLLLPTICLLVDEARKLSTVAILAFVLIPLMIPISVEPTQTIPNEGMTLVWEDQMTFRTAKTTICFLRNNLNGDKWGRYASMWIVTVTIDQKWGILRNYVSYGSFSGSGVTPVQDSCRYTYFGFLPKSGDIAYEEHSGKVGKQGAYIDWNVGKCYGWWSKDQIWTSWSYTSPSQSHTRWWSFYGTAPATWNLRTAAACNIEIPKRICGGIHFEVWDGWCGQWHWVETIDYQVGICW